MRNNIFDAAEPEWASNGETQQPLRLNQFGGSLGGPIKRDKTFFFLASEAYRQNWGYPVSGDVPSASLLATVPSLVADLPDHQCLPAGRSKHNSDALDASQRPE